MDAGLLSQRPGFNPREILGAKVALGQVSHRKLRFSPVGVIPQLLHVQLFVELLPTPCNLSN